MTNQEKIAHRNSVLKSFIWRVMGVLVYALIFYLFTRRWQLTFLASLTHHSTFLLEDN